MLDFNSGHHNVLVLSIELCSVSRLGSSDTPVAVSTSNTRSWFLSTVLFFCFFCFF